MDAPMQPAPVVVDANPPKTTVLAEMAEPVPTILTHSHSLTCGHCGATASTKVEAVNGTFAWVLCLLLCCFGCWLGCCLIPFYVDSCKDYYHKCGNCDKLIAVKKTM